MPKFVPGLLLNQQGVIPLVVIVAAGIIGSSGATVVVSQSSIPGEVLYPVKKVTENIRVATAFSNQDKAKVHLSIAEEKVKEIEKLEEKGATDEILEAAQELENSQNEALQLTQNIISEGGNVDELIELLEVQNKRGQAVFVKVSDKIPPQINEELIKSLEQFGQDVEIAIESVEDSVEEGDQQEFSQQTPCPSPSQSEEDAQEESGSQEEETEGEDDWWGKWFENEDGQDVQGISTLRNRQSDSFGGDPCDSGESSSDASSRAFDGGVGSSEFEDSDGVGSDQSGESADAPTNTSPDVEGASTIGGLLQQILNALFPPQR